MSIVKSAYLGYALDKNYNKNYITKAYSNVTSILENFFSNNSEEEITVDISENFGIDSLDNKIESLSSIMEDKDWEGYLKLSITFEAKPNKNYIFIEDEGCAVLEDGTVIEREDDEIVFAAPSKKKKQKTEKVKDDDTDEDSDDEEKNPMDKALDLIGQIAKFIGAPSDKVDAAKAWIKQNPEMAGALSSVILPRILDFVRGKPVDLSLSGLGISAAQGAIIAAALSYFMGDKAPKIGGTSPSGAGDEGGVLGKLSTFLVGPQDDFIVYDRGASKDPETAELQRCLIRFSGGNLEAERKNLPSSYYELNKNARGYAEFTAVAKTGPIIGTKGGTLEKPVYYADDGRFGDKTLVAVNALYQKINEFNKKNNSTVQITDPQKIPTKILQSPACIDQSSPIVQPGEIAYVQQQLEKMKSASTGVKKIEESKLYTDFSFLSTKNAKLHSVLMEQLKKDLKRG